jgi:PPE-repeat protein
VTFVILTIHCDIRHVCRTGNRQEPYWHPLGHMVAAVCRGAHARRSLGKGGRCSGSQAGPGFVRHRFCSERGRRGRREAAAGSAGVVAVDFGALPPEINSGRMYAGAGSGPLLAAAAAWDGLASELSSAATSYQSTVSELTGAAWLGPSSASMAAAAAPYVTWMNTTAAQAQQTASQLASAVAAYEAAFAATVPPPVIAANRALLASLVATNILGQNTPAIAATQAQYAEMWAQDAAAMYGYAGASAAATTLTPFSAPTQNTNPAGTATQAAAVTQATAAATGTTQSTLSQVVSTMPSTLQSLASGGSSDPVTAIVAFLNTPANQALENFAGVVLGGDTPYVYDPLFVGASAFSLTSPLLAQIGAAPAVAASAASAVSAAPEDALGTLAGSYGSGAGSAGLGGAGVSAGLGRAAAVGGLSVPQSWGTTSPAIRLAATALPSGGLDGLPEAGAAGPGGWFGGLPPVGSVVNAPRNGATGPRSGSRLKVIPQMAAAPGVHDDAPDRAVKPNGRASDALGTLSERERDELDELRKQIAELAMERDAAARLIREAIR